MSEVIEPFPRHHGPVSPALAETLGHVPQPGSPESLARAAEQAVAQLRQYTAWIRADAGPDVCRDALAGLEELARQGDETVRRLRVEGWGR